MSSVETVDVDSSFERGCARRSRKLQKTEDQVRSAIAQAGTMVVKIGSSSLTEKTGELDPTRLLSLVVALSEVRRMGTRLLLVSSGAIAAGFGPLGFSRRPEDVVSQQAAASVGQGLLMLNYEKAFSRMGVRVGQILLTAEDTMQPTQYRNARRTLDRLLELGVMPIINENDALASNEIRFGDNDRLSALVANIVRADALILLTDVDGLYTLPPSLPGSRHISFVPDVIDASERIAAGGSESGLGTGGMATKLEAARIAAISGIPTIVTSTQQAGPAMMGDPVGTSFAPLKDRASSKRLWISFAAEPHGRLVVDQGAISALRGGRASLLSVGVVRMAGEFSANDAVWIDDEHGNHLAKGLVSFDSEEIPQLLGRNSQQLKRLLGGQYTHPLVHRDNLVLLQGHRAGTDA